MLIVISGGYNDAAGIARGQDDDVFGKALQRAFELKRSNSKLP
jgi:hypothetical protein